MSIHLYTFPWSCRYVVLPYFTAYTSLTYSINAGQQRFLYPKPHPGSTLPPQSIRRQQLWYEWYLRRAYFTAGPRLPQSHTERDWRGIEIKVSPHVADYLELSSTKYGFSDWDRGWVVAISMFENAFHDISDIWGMSCWYFRNCVTWQGAKSSLYLGSTLCDWALGKGRSRGG